MQSLHVHTVLDSRTVSILKCARSLSTNFITHLDLLLEMAQTESMRCMDDFLLNPTIVEQDSQQFDMALARQDDITAPRHMGKGKAVATNAEPTSFTILDESIFQLDWPLYTSDEEVASPLDNDRTSQYSRTTSFSSNFSMPELLEDMDGNVVEQCEEARKVTFQSAGKAKMVSTPKIDPSRRSMCLPPMTTESRRPSIVIPARRSSIGMPRSARSSQDSRTSSSRNNSISSAAPNSPASTAPSSVYDDFEDEPAMLHKKNISRHIDLMQAAAMTCTSPVSPMVERISTFDSEVYPTARRGSIASIRRKSKFSSGFALNKVKTFVRRDSIQVDEMENVKEPDPVTFTQQVSQPKRYSSGRPKLVARAANERAPPITLPPFPDGE